MLSVGNFLTNRGWQAFFATLLGCCALFGAINRLSLDAVALWAFIAAAVLIGFGNQIERHP